MTQTITVSDNLQDDYSYEQTEPVGKHFAEGFNPELTPKEMLELGVFGGEYFEGYIDEFPKSWFEKARLSDTFDKTCNFYGVKASQPREEWQRKGWMHDDDPRGWFQWYCRYYNGRRLADEDERQIKRWRAFRRHAGQVKAACYPGDLGCRPVQRQALLHWAYDSRKI